jgi:hypothetical protein
MFMDNYKRTTPCNRCGVVAFMATQAFFVKLPTTTYRRPISALVSGGAAEARLLRAAEERELLCEKCFREEQYKNPTVHGETPIDANFEVGDVYKNPSKCKPPTEYMLNMFASHGMNIKFFGTCLEPEHPYDACLYAIFDTATGKQLSADEWRAKMGLLPE